MSETNETVQKPQTPAMDLLNEISVAGQAHFVQKIASQQGLAIQSDEDLCQALVIGNAVMRRIFDAKSASGRFDISSHAEKVAAALGMNDAIAQRRVDEINDVVSQNESLNSKFAAIGL